MTEVATPQETLEELTSAQIEHLREECRQSIFFLAKGVLGYNEVEEGAHAALCAFLEQEPKKRRMVLMPRGYLKSTLCTITDSIRQSLINPNVRILIQNEVFDNAANFLLEIKNHWTTNALLRGLFPDLAPVKFAGPGVDWSSAAASILRSSTKKESTYTAAGSGGSPQSQHFEFIKNDDLIGTKAKNSEAAMLSSIDWVDSQTPLLNRLDDQLDYYGTRKTMVDIYAHLIETLGDSLAVFSREPIENGASIFGKMPIERLMEIMVNTPDVWAHDYMNNPTGKGGIEWSKDYTRYYTLDEVRGKVIFEDSLNREIRSWGFHELYICITVDPNSGKQLAPDKAAIVVHGCTPQRGERQSEVFVLETWDGRPSPQGLIEQIFDLACKWNPQIIGIEEAGQSTTLYWFERYMAKMRRFFSVKGTKPGNKDKASRIKQSIDPLLKQHRIYFLREQLALVSQIQFFPQLAIHNWDLIDCLAQGPQVYQDGLDEGSMKEAAEAEKKILSIRGQTGYGSSIRSYIRR